MIFSFISVNFYKLIVKEVNVMLKSNKVFELRKSIKMKTTEFSNFIGISRQSVFLYEKNRRDPTPKIAKKIINKFKKINREISFEDIYINHSDK